MASLISRVTSPERLQRRVVLVADRVIPQRRRRLSERHWQCLRSGELIDFSAEPSSDGDARLRSAAALLRPVTAPGLKLARVGGAADGGYVMMEPLKAMGALSVGVGPDVSWDSAVALMGIPVAMFDPTISRPPERVPGTTFHRVGVGAVDSGEYRTLIGLRDLAGFGPDVDLVLGMDVEGAEWESIQATGARGLRQFTQITLELHGFDQLSERGGSDLILDVLRILNAGHKPVYLHGNNLDWLHQFGAYWFPRTLEATFVRDDLISGWEPASKVDGWGTPNDTRLPDIRLDGLLSLTRT